LLSILTPSLVQRIDFEALDRFAMSSTDLQAAEKLHQAQRKLYKLTISISAYFRLISGLENTPPK